MKTRAGIRFWARAPLGKAYRLALFVVLASAHAALMLTGEMSPVHFPIVAVALVLAARPPEKLGRLSRTFWNVISIAVLLGSLAVAMAPPRNFETFYHGICYFLLYIFTIRYFTRTRPRDDLVLFLLGLLEVCAASIANVSISFLISIAVFSGGMVAGLMLFSMLSEMDKARTTSVPGAVLDDNPAAADEDVPAQDGPWPGPASGAPIAGGSFLAFALASTLMVFVLGFTFFFFIPRMGRGLFSWRAGLKDRVSGFSETVEMGSTGRIKQSNVLVMRVRLDSDDPLPGTAYFRGHALDHYDGRRWKDSLGAAKYYNYSRGQTVTLPGMGPLARSVRQEVILEPTDSNIIFGLPRVGAISGPPPFRAVVHCHNDYIRFPWPYPIYDRISYVIWSVPQAADLSVCEGAWAGAGGKFQSPGPGAYLQLPDGSEEIGDLARQVAGRGASPCEQARLIRDYLLANYEYDLDTPSDRAADPLKDFLLNSRRGYCEHYASSMVVMLRALGIPARVAAGYLEGEWNPFENYYRVAERHAHTWVEMRLADGSWMTIDPTPPVEAGREYNPYLNWMGDLVDSLKYRWDRYVVDLNVDDQRRMALFIRDRGTMAGKSVSSIPSRARAIASLLGRSPLAIAVIVLAAAAYLVLSSRGRKGGPAGGRGGGSSRLVREYGALLKLVERKGTRRGRAETHLELAGRIEVEGWPFAKDFLGATLAYLAVRFGGADAEGRALSGIRRAMKSIRFSKGRGN